MLVMCIGFMTLACLNTL